MKNIVYILILLGFGSCATLFTKKYQFIEVRSEPPGAVVKVNGGKVGITPMQVPVKKNYEWPKISVEKEGFVSQSFYLPSTLKPWVVFGNNIGVWAWIIDGATGKFLRYKTKKYELILERDTTSVIIGR